MYGNSLFVTPGLGDGGFTVENIDQAGVLKTAKWVEHRNLTKETSIAAGKDIFRVECQSCHTLDKYRGLKQYLEQRGWDEATRREMLGSLDLMHNGVMPPFAGKNLERDALVSFMATIHPDNIASGSVTNNEVVFERYCAPCHMLKPGKPPFAMFDGTDDATADAALQDLKVIFERMPNLHLNAQERTHLIQWIRERSSTGR
jgi:mono/diheme cytochrome c family protein